MSRGNSSIVDDEGNFSFLSLDITPAPDPFTSRPIDSSQSPETPHPNLHSRQRSESRQLLPESKEIFNYSTARYFDFGNPSGRQNIRDERYSDWVDEPKTLPRSRKEVVRDLVFDLVVVMFPLCLYALAGAMVR